MINVKKILKGVGVVGLFFFLAILGYVFTPFLALLIVSIQSLTAVLIQLTIALAVLALIKLLIQVLTGKKMKFQIFQKLKDKMRLKA